MLGDKIVKDYYKVAQCTASHLAAFTGFEIIRKKNSKLDLYSLFRIPVEDLEIKYDEFAEAFLNLREILFEYEKMGKIRVSNILRSGDHEAIIRSSVYNVGTFHAQRPLLFNKEGNIYSQDLKTLYYYRNRLDGYGIEQYI
jgi:glycerol-3-phosphate O-acyltransferase